MRRQWLKTREITPVWERNVREKNDDHIASLVISFTEHAYKTEYPLIVFEGVNIPEIVNDMPFENPYLLACGYHRWSAACQVGLEKVFCEIHDGDEEAFIEVMALDNRQFDVSQAGIGLAFTEKERRTACKQLLLLPKYLERTNVSLAKEWKVTEGTVRNWLGDVTKQIWDTQTPIPEERRERLKAILTSNARKSDSGAVVKVAKKRQVPKEELWGVVVDEAFERTASDGIPFHRRHEITRRGFCDAAGEVLDAQIGNIFRKGVDLDPVNPAALRRLHNLILTDDTGFIQACKDAEKAYLDIEAIRSEAEKARQGVRRKVFDLFCQNPGSGQSYDYENDFVERLFRETFKERVGFDYEVDTLRLRYLNDSEAAAYRDKIREVLKDLREWDEAEDTIPENALWVQKFSETIAPALKQDRVDTEAAFLIRQKMVEDALKAYPHIGVADFQKAFLLETYTYCSHPVENMFDQRLAKTLKRDSLTSFVTGFERTIDVFKATEKGDETWISDIEPSETIATLLGEGGEITGVMVFVKVDGNIRQLSPSLSDVSEACQVALLQSGLAYEAKSEAELQAKAISE